MCIRDRSLNSNIKSVSDFSLNTEDYILNTINKQFSTNQDKIALQYNELSISYGQLKQKVSAIAKNLHSHGIQEGSRVVIYLPRSENYIFAILGVLFTKACFVPVPSTHPLERLKYIIQDVQADLVISDIELENIGVKSTSINDCLMSTSGAENIQVGIGELFYILYTSGSTGQPKGVPISHQAFSNYINSASKLYLNVNKYDMPFFTSVGFDLTMTSIFLPLYTGGTIHIYEEESGLNLQIQKVIENPFINCLKCTPSHLKLVEENEISSSIKTIIVGGEIFETDLAKTISENSNNNIAIYNEYGPTEATVGCIVHKYQADETRSKADQPIGTPLANTFAFVANEAGTPLPSGVKGELCIGAVSYTHLTLPTILRV